MARDYSSLSDHDFEQLVADLLSADEGVRYETFMRGADEGIDLRRIDPSGLKHVVQCKHYRKSSFSQLLSAVRKEVVKLRRRGEEFASYRLVTSQELSAKRKRLLAAAYGSIIQRDDDILGSDDIEGLLNRNEGVERAHVKLWLSSGAQLSRVVNAAIWNRSQHLVDDVRRTLDRYVETGIFARAKNQLAASRVLIISGPPGIGKTTLARMLLADCAADGFTPIDVSVDVNEAYAVLDQTLQAFYLDDFLGATFLQDRLAKNEDKRLTALMRRCASDSSKLMILSTREHILQQATSTYEALEEAVTDPRKILLALTSYSALDKGRILYNHLWHSPQVTDDARQQIARERKYLPIVQHESYNPRIIEYATGLAAYCLTSANTAQYPQFVLSALDDPSLIWRHAFEQQLDDDCKDVLVVLATTPGTTCSVDDLLSGYQGQREANGRQLKRNGFRDALRTLDDAFTRSTETDRTTLIDLADPGLEDYIAKWLASDEESSTNAIKGAVSFDQVLWLHRKIVLLDKDALRQTRFRDLLLDAAIRTFDSPSFAWEDIHYDDDPEPTTTKRDPDISGRLLTLLAVGEAPGTLRSDVREFVTKKVNELPRTWNRSRYLNFSSRVRLIEKLINAELIDERQLAMLVLNLADNAYDSFSWERLNELRQQHAKALRPYDRPLRQVFRQWLDGQLMDPDDIEDTYQFDKIMSVARDLQVAPPRSQVAQARATVDSRLDDETESPSSVTTRDVEDDEPGGIDNDEELETLFSRFLQE